MYFERFAARLKPCPFTEYRLSVVNRLGRSALQPDPISYSQNHGFCFFPVTVRVPLTAMREKRDKHRAIVKLGDCHDSAQA